jgi:outer membrane protein
MKKLITAAIAVILSAGLAHAAPPAKAAPAAPAAQAAAAPAVQTVQSGAVKIGFINVRRVVNESDKGKAATQRLQAEVNQTKSKLDGKKSEITTLQKAFEANKDKWDLPTKQAKASEIDQKVKALNREAEDQEEYYQKRENDQLKPIIESLNSVISDIGKKEGYTVIFDATGAILYINDANDVTDKVIKSFNLKK